MRQAIMIDYDYCTGCHSCEIACQQEHGLNPDQYGIRLTKIGPDQIKERKWQLDFVPVTTDRCDKCAERQSKGKLPLCVQSCQAGCMRVGTIEELAPFIAESKKYAIFG